MHAPSVSIIIPTYNRRDRLQRMLRALGPVMAGHDAEIVIVVDGAGDGTVDMLHTLDLGQPLRVFTQANRGPAAARNRGMTAAGGDVVLFLDDDVIPLAGLVEHHLDVHRRDPRAVAIGPMLAPPGARLAPWLQWEAATLQKQYDAMAAGQFAPTPRQFYTANASVRREHALAVGGFDESFTRAEDVEFADRLADRGLQFYYLPKAGVWHEPDRTFGAWLRVAREYGRHAVLFERKLSRAHLELCYREWPRRHVLSRLVTRACVGRPWRGAVVLTCGAAIRCPAPHGDRFQRALCSALFQVEFWQGIADATGLGTGIWDRVRAVGAARRPRAIAAAAAAPARRSAAVQE